MGGRQPFRLRQAELSGMVLAEPGHRATSPPGVQAMPSITHTRRIGVAAAAAVLGLALAGCNQRTNDPTAESAGAHLDDAVITTKVKTAIATDSQAKGVDTSVETRKGAVLLSGFVDNQAQADREVQLAKAVEGVTSVDSKLMVKDGKSTAGNVLDDSVVTVKVKSALLADSSTKGSEIAVTTDKGVVQLSGYVDSADEQARATAVARGVDGVQNVVNDTSIKK
jgi:hyperosmotically inducible protein